MDGYYDGKNTDIRRITKNELQYTPNEVLLKRYKTSARRLKKARESYGIKPLKRGRRTIYKLDQMAAAKKKEEEENMKRKKEEEEEEENMKRKKEDEEEEEEVKRVKVQEEVEEEEEVEQVKENDIDKRIKELEKEVYELKGVVKCLMSSNESSKDRSIIDYHKKRVLKDKLKDFEEMCSKLESNTKENELLKKYIDINSLCNRTKIKKQMKTLSEQEENEIEMLTKLF